MANTIVQRTDPEYIKSCDAYAALKDTVSRIFWWDALKLRMFGQVTLSKDHGQLLHDIDQYVKARIASEKVNDLAEMRVCSDCGRTHYGWVSCYGAAKAEAGVS